ncbi:MAG: DUF6402 family protein [Paucimonas sp.]|nr:DUF6402 family protein [Paucimonas sp.]
MSLKDFQQTTALGPNALFLLENATVETKPGGHHQPKQIVIDELPLSKLPVAMRKMGWHTSAALMQRWFDSPGWQMPEEWKGEEGQPDPLRLSKAACEETLVRMNWAMRFKQCQEALKVAEERLNTRNAIDRLKVLLRKAGWDGKGTFALGSTEFSAREVDATAQVNIARMGSSFDVLDDMYGALGRATLKVGVAGRTFTKLDNALGEARNYFQIEYAGFYIRDHYDFNGPQFLGIWTAERVLTKAEMISVTTPDGPSIFNVQGAAIAKVTNDDFRAYRAKTGMGGDFLIYSDVLWKEVNQVIDLGPAT